MTAGAHLLPRSFALVVAVLTSAAFAATVPAGDASVVVGVLGTLLVAWAVARGVAMALPSVTGLNPIVAARDHHRALAQRPVPRHRDPDAAGHTRSRAPSEPVPPA